MDFVRDAGLELTAGIWFDGLMDGDDEVDMGGKW